jgi:hypothetical protein
VSVEVTSVVGEAVVCVRPIYLLDIAENQVKNKLLTLDRYELDVVVSVNLSDLNDNRSIVNDVGHAGLSGKNIQKDCISAP